MTGSKTTFAAAALMMILAAACEKREQSASTADISEAPSGMSMPTSSPAAARGSTGALTLVTDRSLVCMVNNQFMGRSQIPVTVNGRTYYGCCEMCKGRLANDPASRTSVDPVSQRSVDKATAVIGRAEDGTAMYFENEQNLVAYSRQGRSN